MKKVLSYSKKQLIETPFNCSFRDVRKNKCGHPDNLGYVKKCHPEYFPFGCPLDTYLTAEELEAKLKGVECEGVEP